MKQPILWNDAYDDVVDLLTSQSSKNGGALVKYVSQAIRPGCIADFYDDDLEDFLTAEQALARRIVSWIAVSSLRWDPIIAAYESAKDSLMAEVTSTSRQWMNDAPSNKNADAMGEDLTHLSTFSKGTQSDPMGTPMQRLAEISDSLESAFGAWRDELIRDFSLGREI